LKHETQRPHSLRYR